MKARAIVILLAGALCAGAAFAEGRDVPLPGGGRAFVGGADEGDQQVFAADAGGKATQLSRFARRADIMALYPSPDGKKLVVYYRPDKSVVRIALYDLGSKKELAATTPGMACFGVVWYKDRLLFRSGTSGGGDYCFIYDYALERRAAINGYAIIVDLELGLAIAQPLYGPCEGRFVTYDLYDGSPVEEFDFLGRFGGRYYATGEATKGADGAYSFRLAASSAGDERRATFRRALEPARSAAR